VAITAVAGLAYLMLNLFTPPCFAAIGAMNAEMKSIKWLLGGVGLQFFIGYTVSYFVYTIGTLIVNPTMFLIKPAVAGLALVLIMLCVIGYLIYSSNRKQKCK
jgi:ferrous iron transport protein B